MRIKAFGSLAVDVYAQRGAFATIGATRVELDDGSWLEVPAGFVFDGASIPARLRGLIESLTIAGYVAFALHDYAYATGAEITFASGERGPISRGVADELALALCQWLGLDRNDAVEIYEALRFAGGSSYHRLPVGRTLEQWEAAQR